MKRSKITGIIAMVVFIFAMLLTLTNEMIYYARGISGDISIDYARNILCYTLPSLLGIAVLIIGVFLASRNKVTFIYPAGFCVLVLAELIATVLKAVNFAQYSDYVGAYDVMFFVRGVLFLLAFGLLALDGFLLLKNKAFGIVGAVLLFLTATVFSAITSVQELQWAANGSSIDFLGAVENWTFFASMEAIAIGAMIYAIGRSRRIPREAPTPSRVYPPYNYEPPQNGGTL